MAITSSSELGYAMFSKCLAEAGSVDVGQLIRQEMLAIVKAKITMGSLDASRARFVSLMENIGQEPIATFPAKDLVISYRGTKVPAQAISYLQMYMLHQQALCRGRAVDSGVLPPPWCEHVLLSGGAERSWA